MISFVPGYYGHLGNQLFQYAATFGLARRRGTFPHWPHGKQPDLLRLFPELMSIPGATGGDIYREPHFHFDPTFENLPDGTILSGYFQSEKYIGPYAGELRRMLRTVNIVKRVPHVSVHVRRGDYLSFPEHHPPLTVDYYREAMEQFPGASFRVFSDDPGWCLLNLKPLANDVEIMTGRQAIADLMLMAACSHHIIANSSFSWWGAWLDPNPDKKVIAPAKWFGPAKAGWDTKDLLPESWVRL